ncbi:hypothetical protein OIV83_005842 [Microbotryomycetes sp. JL201]|nr:hypothetical protein OIV83_005842 [Microbotryomycetes sp. JL201]
MRVTRSASAIASTAKRTAPAVAVQPLKRRKTAPPRQPATAQCSTEAATTDADEQAIHQAAIESDNVAEQQGVLLHPPALTFEFADARRHLESVDSRWGVLMDKLRCTAFQGEDEGEHKETFNPFKSLVSSIIGQQVSWLAARSIQHKFVRIFYPHLPEKRAPPTTTAPRPEDTPFPTPAQIVNLPDQMATLRSAGLSQRKAEYIIELAERFHDGRLDAKKLWEADDEEIMKTLVAVRGIGVWTVHMFLIFSSKRPNVCPWGDLGIQKSLCRWYSDDPHSTPAIHARKKQREATPTPTTAAAEPKTPANKQTAPVLSYPTPSTPSNEEKETIENLRAMGAVDVPLEEPVTPEAVVPEPPKNPFVFPATSNNLTPGVLKARLAGKKLKGNIYLTPNEMEELMAPLEPYRSVACWYLWALTDGTGDPGVREASHDHVTVRFNSAFDFVMACARPRARRKPKVSYVEIESSDIGMDEQDREVQRIKSAERDKDQERAHEKPRMSPESAVSITRPAIVKVEEDDIQAELKYDSLSLDAFFNLPFDVLYEILGYLDGTDLVHLAETSKILHQVLMSDGVKPVWGTVRKENDLTFITELSDIQFVLLLFGRNCQTCGKTFEYLGPDLARLQRRCQDCIRASSICVPNARFNPPPPALVQFLGRVHPQLKKIVQQVHCYNRSLDSVGFGHSARFYDKNELWELNQKLFSLEEVDEIDQITRESEGVLHLNEGDERAVKGKVAGFLAARRKTIENAQNRHWRLQHERSEKKRLARQARQNSLLRRWRDVSQALQACQWTAEEITLYKEKVWAVEFEGRVPSFQLRSPKSSPSQDEPAWTQMRQGIQRLQLRRAREARRKYLGRELWIFALGHRGERPEDDRAPLFLPDRWHEFLRFPSVKALWNTDDRSTSVVEARDMLSALPGLARDMDAFRYRIRTAAIKLILSLTSVQDLQYSPSSVQQQYSDEIFNKATSTFVYFDPRPGFGCVRLGTFPEFCAATRKQLNVNSLKSRLVAIFDAKTVSVCRKILQAAGLDEQEATINDLRALESRFVCVNLQTGKITPRKYSVEELASE